MPRFRRGAFALFATTFLVSLLLGDRATAAAVLALDVHAVWHQHTWWQPLTALFLLPESGLAALVGTLLIQWYFGSPLEGFWSTRRYLIMVLASGTFGYLSCVAAGLWLPQFSNVTFTGALPLDAATTTAFAIVYARQRYSLFGAAPVQGRVLAGFVLALLFVLPVASGHGVVAILPGVVAALSAALFATQPWRRGPKSGTVGRSKARSAQGSHLRVVRSVDDLLN
ncbi:MAG: hypothetical protein B7733_07640 [Myxococcales bacterium FL481]|nr:MAG: hypothetical protein B7733_07640 [Myxococcales bacterium FL481]